MQRNIVEVITGAVVLFIAAWFVYYFSIANEHVLLDKNVYSLQADFTAVDGVVVGTPVTIGGVKVGVVSDKRLDPNNYMAILTFSMQKNILLPSDSSIKIVSDGLLGSKYLTVSPGGADSLLKDGDKIMYTQSSFNLEDLVGKLLYSVSSSNKDKDKDKENNKDKK